MWLTFYPQVELYWKRDGRRFLKVILLTKPKKKKSNQKIPITTKRFMTPTLDKDFFKTRRLLQAQIPPGILARLAAWYGPFFFFNSCVLLFFWLSISFLSTLVNLPHFLFAFNIPRLHYRIKSVHRCSKFWHLYAVTVPCCWTGFRYAYLSIVFSFRKGKVIPASERNWNKLSGITPRGQLLRGIAQSIPGHWQCSIDLQKS